MEAKDVLLKLRTEHGLSQETLAEKLDAARAEMAEAVRGKESALQRELPNA